MATIGVHKDGHMLIGILTFFEIFWKFEIFLTFNEIWRLLSFYFCRKWSLFYFYEALILGFTKMKKIGTEVGAVGFFDSVKCQFRKNWKKSSFSYIARFSYNFILFHHVFENLKLNKLVKEELEKKKLVSLVSWAGNQSLTVKSIYKHIV